MSTDHPPIDDLDLSAVLDHEADDALVARVASDPAAQQRLERLRVARDAVGGATVADLAPSQVDTLVATALAAADRAPAADDPPGSATGADVRGVVAPLPPARLRRGVPQWAVAAVVVVLVGLGLTLVWTGRDDGDSDQAFQQIGSSIVADDPDAMDDVGAAAEFEADAAAGSDAAGTAESQLDGEATTTAPGAGAATGAAPELVNLGEFPDADALRVHLRDAFPVAAENAPGDLPETGVDDDLTAAFRCLGKVDGLFEPLGDPTSVGLAIVADEPTVVYEMPFRADDGRETALVIAVNEITCIPVLAFQR